MMKVNVRIHFLYKEDILEVLMYSELIHSRKRIDPKYKVLLIYNMEISSII